jgi:hypothetical protein
MKEWLSKRRGTYLIVFDNVDDEDVIDLLPRFFPSSNSGHILITSRRDRIYVLGSCVLVEGLKPQHAADLLLHHAGIESLSSKHLELAGVVVKQLGYLALAIVVPYAFPMPSH